MRRTQFLLFFLTLFAESLYSQYVVLDKIVGIVGNDIIMQSDVEQQLAQLQAQGMTVTREMRCHTYEELLVQTLLLHQARLDSLEVSESMVDQQLDSRLKYFINMIGSREKLEEYFNKTLPEIKQDLRESVREQLITQKMQNKITGDVQITPSEVKEFYKNLPADSIPYVNSVVELRQIVLYPSYNEQAIYLAKEKLLELRKRINDGEKFTTLAKLYSEDPGSARNGGEIGFFGKGELDPEYAKAAFSLKEGQISKIVESQFGFHIIQLIERKDEKVNTRHILIKPKADQASIARARQLLDSIVDCIKKDSLSFEKAAMKYSQDNNSNKNGGLLINPRNASSRFELDQLPVADYYMIKDMAVGDISEPYLATDENGKQVLKVIKLESRTLPHKANLEEDYEMIEQMALENKRNKIITDWIKEKTKSTYIRIDDDYASCRFEYGNWMKK